jgi:predicted DNA-binding transcriptional regulator YafY
MMDARTITQTSRMQKVLDLVTSREATTAEALAEKVGVSVRTIHRYADALRHRGWRVEGERGVGFIYRGRTRK